MKKIRIVDVFFVLFFTVGFFVLNYPAISNIWNQYRQSLLISNYQQRVDNTDQATLEKMWKAAKNYNEAFAERGVLSLSDAFSEDETSAGDELYDSLLDLSKDGVMGSIEIPKINAYLSIKHGVSDEVLQDSVGHLPGTSLPVGGETSHCLLAAHRGLPTAELFTDLDQIEEGDIFYIHVLDHTLKYEVDQIDTVLPDEVSGLKLEDGKDYVTLITCTPYGVNTHRMLVRGVNVPYDDSDEVATSTPMKSLRDWILQEKTLVISTCVVLLMIIGSIIRAIINRKNHKKKKKGKKKKKKSSKTKTKKKNSEKSEKTKPKKEEGM